MQINAPYHTIAHQKTRPMTVSRDASQVPTASVAKAVSNFLGTGDGKKTPELEAVWFYLLNHAVADIAKKYHPEEPLPDDVLGVLEKYNSHLGEKSARMFYYVLIICIRESRHLNNKAALKTAIVNKWGLKSYKFLSSIPDSGSSAMSDWFKNPADITLGQCVETLQYAFYNGNWSSGYGGSAWGEVSDALVSFVKGETTAEMFMDTAFTLAHNNGPIFNKGMLYYSYNSSLLTKILDCQRAGMIPHLLNDDSFRDYVKGGDMGLHQVADEVRNTLKGDFLDGYVDWYAVEDLGSLGKYPSEKALQKAKYGEPEEYLFKKAHKEKLEEQKKKEEKEAAEKEKNSWYFIGPNTKFKKLERIEL